MCHLLRRHASWRERRREKEGKEWQKINKPLFFFVSLAPSPRPAAMGKAKQTKKFAEVKRLRNPKDLKP